MSNVKVKVAFTETWRRTTTTEIDADEFAQWAGKPVEQADSALLAEYLDSVRDDHDIPWWMHGIGSPGTDSDDEFDGADIDEAEVETP